MVKYLFSYKNAYKHFIDIDLKVKTKGEKLMTTKGPRKIKELSLNVEMPQDLTHKQFKILQKATEGCPVLQNLKDSIKIILNEIFGLSLGAGLCNLAMML